MSAMGWVVVFLIVCVLVSLVAAKKGRSGTGLFFAMAGAAIPAMIAVSYVLGDNMEAKPFAMWIAAFLCPVVGFIWAIMTKNAGEMAAQSGSYGDMKKCPFCAEPVRREAIKCKHCGSTIEAGA